MSEQVSVNWKTLNVVEIGGDIFLIQEGRSNTLGSMLKYGDRESVLDRPQSRVVSAHREGNLLVADE